MEEDFDENLKLSNAEVESEDGEEESEEDSDENSQEDNDLSKKGKSLLGSLAKKSKMSKNKKTIS